MFQKCLFSVYSRWIHGFRTVLAIAIRESRSKAVKTPLAVPKIATGSVRCFWPTIGFNVLLVATVWQRAVRVAFALSRRQHRKSGCSFDARQVHACLAVGQADQGQDDPPSGRLSRIAAHREQARRSGYRLRCTRELLFGLLAPAASKPISRISAG